MSDFAVLMTIQLTETLLPEADAKAFNSIIFTQTKSFDSAAPGAVILSATSIYQRTQKGHRWRDMEDNDSEKVPQ